MTVEGSPQMGQCSVTGKMVPEDELITLNGQRVCAEGKVILLERLKAGDAMPGELEKPTVLRRFGCIFLDGIIIGLPMTLISRLVVSPDPVAQGMFTIVATALQVIYFGQMHASRGQTIGKIAGKLRVVNMDGSPISAGTAYIRAVAYSAPSFVSGVAQLLNIAPLVLAAALLVIVWGLATIILALVDSKYQRALHDQIARTRVVVAD